MNIFKSSIIIASLLLASFGSYKLGSLTAEIKTALIFSLDDISSLIAIKDELSTEESKHLYETLKNKYLSRHDGLRMALESSNWEKLIKLDPDIERGYRYFEDRRKRL